ncbi:hypothetical protein KY342_01375 [Candidatus Woesearchaeota archaeon]|nr:hypothetical protein [Candidatus Woesearchaeota archaeon]
MKDSFDNIKCIILCAGKGSRLIPQTLNIPKSMLIIDNKPIIEHIINYWKRFTNDFIFIVGYKKKILIDFIKKLPINAEFIEQKELKGIAHAILLTKDIVSDNFIVVLGDCICNGEFNFSWGKDQSLGVWKTENEDDIKRSYSVEIKDNKIVKVIEKPKEIINNLCGMGYYFFSRKVFDYIKKTKSSALRGEIEITDVIQMMIDGGERIRPVFFNGDYINVTYEGDLEKAKNIFSYGIKK